MTINSAPVLSTLGVDMVRQLAEPVGRYSLVGSEKAGGATYTPELLARFVARQIAKRAQIGNRPKISLLDPAVGDGQLLVSLLSQLASETRERVEVHGFETDQGALATARSRLMSLFPHVPLNLRCEDFLWFALDRFGGPGTLPLFAEEEADVFDLIIANPPYVRTQIMGASQAQVISGRFGLSGRVDLCHAFLVAMVQALSPGGVAGVIVSNRFMTTRSGAAVRKMILERCNVCAVWDLGDTKLFDAAVLPSVLLLEGKKPGAVIVPPKFTSIYETANQANAEAADPLEALDLTGVVSLPDGRHFRVTHGMLDSAGAPGAVWRLSTEESDFWLSTVAAHTWRTFGDIGHIRVGIKTCADEVFVRSGWDEFPADERPELLRPLTTHHVARRFKPIELQRPWLVLYPHEMNDGHRQAVDLARYPRSRLYLERYRERLEGRRYLVEGGRKWFEIWVPQDPSAWHLPKLVFRDISEKPTFWIDQEGSIVNGDCYWLAPKTVATSDLIWLAVAVANSSFMEAFYDHRFHNKLYSSRRRFITQYVENFPLPDPNSKVSLQMVALAKAIHETIDTCDVSDLLADLDALVWATFGLAGEESDG